jgi:hypothetical protein
MNEYLGVVVWIIVVAACMVGFWATMDMIARARDSGYRYWAVNPLATVHAFRLKNFVVFLIAGIIVAACVLAVSALH